MKSILLGMFTLGFAALLMVSLAQITSITFESKESAAIYEDLHRFADPAPPSVTVPGEEPGEAVVIEEDAQMRIVLPEIGFKALTAQNAETTGWLVLERKKPTQVRNQILIRRAFCFSLFISHQAALEVQQAVGEVAHFQPPVLQLHFATFYVLPLHLVSLHCPKPVLHRAVL